MSNLQIQLTPAQVNRIIEHQAKGILALSLENTNYGGVVAMHVVPANADDGVTVELVAANGTTFDLGK